MSLVSPESPPCGGARVQSGQSGTLHHFITRYTVERPDDPSRLGVDIRLEEGNPNDPVMEVECGGNKGLLFVTKLCQGSKGMTACSASVTIDKVSFVWLTFLLMARAIKSHPSRFLDASVRREKTFETSQIPACAFVKCYRSINCVQV